MIKQVLLSNLIKYKEIIKQNAASTNVPWNQTWV